MYNCNRPNSGTVSHIQFKLGIGIGNPSDMTPWSKGQRLRSHGHIMYTAKICLNSVYRAVRSISYAGADMWTTPPASEAQNGCHGNTGCLATGLKILGFMTSLTSIIVLETSEIGIHVQHKASVT